VREVCEFIWYMSSIKGTSTVIYLFTVSTQGVQNVIGLVVVVVHMYVCMYVCVYILHSYMYMYVCMYVCVHPVVQNKTG
jgi:hypothetical protein